MACIKRHFKAINTAYTSAIIRPPQHYPQPFSLKDNSIGSTTNHSRTSHIDVEIICGYGSTISVHRLPNSTPLFKYKGRPLRLPVPAQRVRKDNKLEKRHTITTRTGHEKRQP